MVNPLQTKGMLHSREDLVGRLWKVIVEGEYSSRNPSDLRGLSGDIL